MRRRPESNIYSEPGPAPVGRAADRLAHRHRRISARTIDLYNGGFLLLEILYQIELLNSHLILFKALPAVVEMLAAYHQNHSFRYRSDPGYKAFPSTDAVIDVLDAITPPNAVRVRKKLKDSFSDPSA
jgi:hypothetical protein